MLNKISSVVVVNFLLHFLYALSNELPTDQTVLNVRAWQSTSIYPNDSDFPELSVAEILEKPNTAIGFSGGGSRAYIGALGYLAGLNQLGLLKNVRYIGGISGGAWATTVFNYAQNNVSDAELLGSIVEPQSIRYSDLQEMSPNCARGFASKNLTLIGLKALIDGTVSTVQDAWIYGVHETYMAPAGIKHGDYFSLNKDTVDDIKKRNPSLAEENFLLPASSNRPYMIIGTSLEGPSSLGPYLPETQNYTMIELTPLYVGQMKAQEVTYTSQKGLSRTRHVGGVVESFAFSTEGSVGPTSFLEADQPTGLLKVPVRSAFKPLDLSTAAGASSYAPGALFTSLPKPLADKLGMTMDYWSPSATSSSTTGSSTPSYFCDGGSYENMPLINFLQRKVRKVVLFYTSFRALMPSDQWDPYTQPFSADKLTDDLAALFGVLDPAQSKFYSRNFEVERNQVFAQDDFAPVVAALQAAQQEGRGIVASFELNTVANEWWGIPAGQAVSLTVAYLGRLSVWESRLGPEMKTLLVPHDEESRQDLSKDIQHGPFRNFPHYNTAGGEINHERANVLADLTGWTVQQHKDLFRKALS